MGLGSRFRLKALSCGLWAALLPVCGFAADKPASAPVERKAPADGSSFSSPALAASVSRPLSAAEAALAAGAEKGDARMKMALGLRYAMGRGVLADDARAQMWLKRAAVEGNAVAQVSLAAMMAFESDVQDAPGAAVWFGKAAAQGNTQAQAELARMLETGLGVSRNPEEAKQWREEAREQADKVMLDWTWRIAATGSEKWQVPAGRPLVDRAALPAGKTPGQATQKGIAAGIATPDHAGISLEVKAVGRAVESGDPQAQTVGALLLATGNGVEKDEALAVEWFRKAAQAGYAPAQAVLGELYMLGWGPLEADNAAAAQWMKRAAMQGLREAQTSYGSMLAGGKGVKENKREAFGWIRQAAERDEARAQLMMAMNALSKGDREGAAKWFYRAAENGDDEVLSILGVLYGWGDGAIAGESEKMTEVRRYAQRGEPEAQLMLGLLYGEGWGAPRDGVLAEYWFEEAVRQHYADVLLPMGLFYAETDRPALAAGLFDEAVRQRAYAFARDREILQLLFIETERMPELEEALRHQEAASGKEETASPGGERDAVAGKTRQADGVPEKAAMPDPARAAFSGLRQERIVKKIAFLKERAAQGDPAAELMMATLLEEGWSVPKDAETARMLRDRAREKICAAGGEAADEPECASPDGPEEADAAGSGGAFGQEDDAGGSEAGEEEHGEEDEGSLSLKVTDYPVKGGL